MGQVNLNTPLQPVVQLAAGSPRGPQIVARDECDLSELIGHLLNMHRGRLPANRYDQLCRWRHAKQDQQIG